MVEVRVRVKFLRLMLFSLAEITHGDYGSLNIGLPIDSDDICREPNQLNRDLSPSGVAKCCSQNWNVWIKTCAPPSTRGRWLHDRCASLQDLEHHRLDFQVHDCVSQRKTRKMPPESCCPGSINRSCEQRKLQIKFTEPILRVASALSAYQGSKLTG